MEIDLRITKCCTRNFTYEHEFATGSVFSVKSVSINRYQVLNKGTFEMKFLIVALLLYSLISCSESPTSITKSYELLSIGDYQYVQSKYFFIDTYYRERFESAISENGLEYYIDDGMKLKQIHAWVLTNKIVAESDEFIGVASTDPEFYKSIDLQNFNDEYDEVVFGIYRLLRTDEYEIDIERGILNLNKTIDNNTALGISYTLENGTKVGTMLNEMSSFISCKLLKPDIISTTDLSTWPLMMRNVYELGDSLNEYGHINIKVINIYTEEFRDSTEISYANQLGLDINDQNHQIIQGGDGQIDDNPLIFNKLNGVLIFPGLQPFYPLSESRFQLNEQFLSDIYTVTSNVDRLINSRFNISIFVSN
jgi:hypothetical protein